jgi:hypothetical protein
VEISAFLFLMLCAAKRKAFKQKKTKNSKKRLGNTEIEIESLFLVKSHFACDIKEKKKTPSVRRPTKNKSECVRFSLVASSQSAREPGSPNRFKM